MNLTVNQVNGAQNGQDRAFCATLSTDGTMSSCSDQIGDLKPLLEKASVAWVDYLIESAETEAVECAAKMGFSETLVRNLLQDVRGSYEDYDTEMGLLLPAIKASGFDVTIEPLIILIRGNLLVTMHTRSRRRFFQIRRYAERYLRKLPKDMKTNDLITLLLIRIIDENNSWNFKQLQEMDERSDDLTMDLKEETVARTHVGEQIYHMKHALVIYLSALWGTADTLSSMRYGDADLISDDPMVLEKIAVLINEVHQQMGLAEHLAEVLASGLECMQSIFNNQLQDKNNLLQERNNQLQSMNNNLSEKNNILTVTNNRLTLLGAFLAIIGAGFVVPNTIATVFSQTNIFQLGPHDMGWYLALIVLSTVVTTTLVYLWVKKIGLLPKTLDGEK